MKFRFFVTSWVISLLASGPVIADGILKGFENATRNTVFINVDGYETGVSGNSGKPFLCEGLWHKPGIRVDIRTVVGNAKNYVGYVRDLGSPCEGLGLRGHLYELTLFGKFEQKVCLFSNSYQSTYPAQREAYKISYYENRLSLTPLLGNVVHFCESPPI